MHGHSRTSNSKKVDGEVGLELGETLLPGLSHEKNTVQWGSICKVYVILSIQILIAAIVSSVTVVYAPIHNFLRGKSGLLFFLICLPFILLWPLHVYRQKHPHNLVFLGLFTASVSFVVGFNCANTEVSGRIVLRALILTAAVVCSLTGYTFWASKKGKHFSYLQPFLFTSLFVLMLIGFVQMLLPVWPISYAIFGAMGAVIFSGYLVYDTDNLIKGFHGDQFNGA